jgi:restriction system protein
LIGHWLFPVLVATGGSFVAAILWILLSSFGIIPVIIVLALDVALIVASIWLHQYHLTNEDGILATLDNEEQQHRGSLRRRLHDRDSAETLLRDELFWIESCREGLNRSEYLFNLERDYLECERRLTKLRADFAEQERKRQEEEARRRHATFIRLSQTDWRPLKGVPFENFIQEVFEWLGFAVQTTATTGDHGADLIVSKGRIKFAVQCKGYTGNVGNDAVQEAHAGTAYYDCQFGVVITTSDFTSAARALASKCSCVLIRGDQILALLDGKFEFWHQPRFG